MTPKTAEIASWPGPVLRLTEAESTQDLAKGMAESGSPEWTLIRALRQTRGRGRLSRRWSSPVGGLYFSLILRPRISPARLGELSLIAAGAAARAAAGVSGLETTIKPPNDVLARCEAGPWKKICGILIEASGGADLTDWVVLGLGMNVNNSIPPNLAKAASLRDLSNREFNLEAVEARVLSELRSAYSDFLRT